MRRGRAGRETEADAELLLVREQRLLELGYRLLAHSELLLLQIRLRLDDEVFESWLVELTIQ